MPKATCRKIFGNARISGKANLHQGDVHIHVKAAYLALRNELGLPSTPLALEHLSEKDKEFLKRLLANLASSQKRRKFRSAIATGGQEARYQAPPSGHKDILQLESQGLSGDSKDEKDVNVPPFGTPGWLHHILRPFVTPAVALHPPHSDFLPSSTGYFAAQGQPEHTLTQQQSYAERELFVLVTTILSYMFGRHIAKEDFLHFLSRCQTDQLLPVLTFLLGVGLCRFFCTKRTVWNPAPLSPTVIYLEDAFGHKRPLSIDICLDFSILRGFLKVHYRGTAGEQLINAGQYHLMLGTRRGMVVNASNWKSASIKAGAHLVNPVYVKSENLKCLVCTGILEISKIGEFHCVPCNRFYRDFDALKYVTASNDEILPSMPLRGQRTSGREAIDENLDVPEQTNVEDDRHDHEPELANLLLVDLRIVPPRKPVDNAGTNIKQSTQLLRFLRFQVHSYQKPESTHRMLRDIFRKYGKIVSLVLLEDDCYRIEYTKAEDAVQAQVDLQRTRWVKGPALLTLNFITSGSAARMSKSASASPAPDLTALPGDLATSTAPPPLHALHGKNINSNDGRKGNLNFRFSAVATNVNSIR